MSRIGVIGPAAPDYFAENVGDALQRLGHVVTQLGPARPRSRSRLVFRAAGLARQALPRLDELAQDRIVRAALGADCEIVINVDSAPHTIFFEEPFLTDRLRAILGPPTFFARLSIRWHRPIAHARTKRYAGVITPRFRSGRRLLALRRTAAADRECCLFKTSCGTAAVSDGCCHCPRFRVSGL